jgi:AcrR family transcriptional regulator
MMVYNKTDKIIEKQQNLRQRIVRAAREVLAEEEKGKTSIKAIAKKAGIATGTFYLYFTNKEVLIDTVVKELYTELLDIIKKEREQYTDVFDKLQASMEICIKTFMKEKHLAKILLDHFPEVNTAFNKKFIDIENDLIRFAKQDLDELLELNLIPEQDTWVSSTAFVGTFRQVILSWISNGEPEDFDHAYRTLIDYNMRGLGRLPSNADFSKDKGK